MMRQITVAAASAVALAGLAACGSSTTPGPTNTAGSAASCSYASIQKDLYQKGALTVATDKPAYSPWFENNDPANGKGYESAVTYAVAKQLGFKPSQVHWAYEPFNDSYAPGPKKFDFDINEISYTPQRAQAVTFSNSYYNVTQALVAMKGTSIVTKHSPAELKTYLFGDQIGTTSLQYINTAIQPSTTPKVYQTLNVVASALQAHQIEAFVTDTPTAQYMATVQIPHAVMIGQFPLADEHYGLLFSKGNPLVTCVNKALGTLATDGKLAALQKQYLGIYNNVTMIKP